MLGNNLSKFYLVNYDHSLTVELAEKYNLPAYSNVILDEKPKIDFFESVEPGWVNFAGDKGNVLPKEIYVHTDYHKWDIDFYSNSAGCIISEKLFDLFYKKIGSKFRYSQIKGIFDKNGNSIKRTNYYFLQFVESVEAFNIDEIDFFGKNYDVIGGENKYTENDGDIKIITSNKVTFKEHLPPIFLSREVSKSGSIFCGEEFKLRCSNVPNKGMFFTPIEELIVVDFWPYDNNSYEARIPTIISKSQRNKWRPPVIRDKFIDLSIEHLLSENSVLDDEQREILRKMAQAKGVVD